MATSTQQKNFNKEFKFVFRPKNSENFGGRKAFGVSANTLAQYIGEDNAAKLLEKVWNMLEDKSRFKYRVQGTIYAYAK